MKLYSAVRVVSFAVAGAVAATAMAQQTQRPAAKSDTSSQQQSMAKPGAPVAGEIPLGIAVAETVMIQRGFRASRLTKADVYNDRNEKIGKIDDFIVAPDGKLTTAILDVGGFLGVAAHRVAIPLEQFTDISAKKVVLPGASKDELKKLTEFKYRG